MNLAIIPMEFLAPSSKFALTKILSTRTFLSRLDKYDNRIKATKKYIIVPKVISLWPSLKRVVVNNSPNCLMKSMILVQTVLSVSISIFLKAKQLRENIEFSIYSSFKASAGLATAALYDFRLTTAHVSTRMKIKGMINKYHERLIL